MANNNKSGRTPQQRQILEQYKNEAANQVGVNLNDYDIKSRDAGSVGGQMVKNMINRTLGSTSKQANQ